MVVACRQEQGGIAVRSLQLQPIYWLPTLRSRDRWGLGGQGGGGRQNTHPYLTSANPTGFGDSGPMRGCSLHSYCRSFGSEHRNPLDEYTSSIPVHLNFFFPILLYISFLSPSLLRLPHSSSLLHFFPPFLPPHLLFLSKS